MSVMGAGRWRWLVCRGVGGLVLAVVALGLSARVASAGSVVSCRTYAGIPVALGAGEPVSYSVTGELCATPAELVGGETVQLLIHGATYNHAYWDFGTIDGVSYSYARDVAAAGFPAFAIDEIGVGHTSHPPSSLVSLQAAAYVAHQIVQALLHGSVAATRFGKVIEVGHSFGSYTTWEEAGTYHDVAAAIITGAAHELTTFGLTHGPAALYPAIGDPRFAGSGLDSGYLTTVPGTRASLFYNSADSDPNVIAADENETPFTQETFATEAGKDVISATEFSAVATEPSSTVSQQIGVPVLVILGSNDSLMCGPEPNGDTFDCSSGHAIAGEEAPWYAPAAQLHACAIPTSGHDINLEVNHVLEEADAIIWSYEYVGQNGLTVPKSAGLPTRCS